MDRLEPELLVVCLCADWCGTCREYRAGFEALAAQRPDATFRWLDIEDDAESVGDLEIETFPTVLIQRKGTVLFFGPVRPQHVHLQRMIDTLGTLPEADAIAYAQASEERRAWQSLRELGLAAPTRSR